MEALLPFFVENGRNWVLSRRNELRDEGEPLASGDRDEVAAFFDAVLLDAIRVVRVDRIENPPFYAELEKAGITIPLDFTETAAITFNDTIVVAEPKIPAAHRISLIFHECVHVVQYKVLGVERFMEEYVHGWARAGFSYGNIPLEQEAYRLQKEFDKRRGRFFSVEAAVRQRLEEQGER